MGYNIPPACITAQESTEQKLNILLEWPNTHVCKPKHEIEYQRVLLSLDKQLAKPGNILSSHRPVLVN